MLKGKHICLLIAVVLFSGCIRFVTPTSGVVIDLQKARSFSDGFMEDIANDRRDALYARMESEFHKITSREQFDTLLDNIYAQIGKPLRYEFIRDGVGAKLLFNGTTKATRKVVYRAKTTKGTYQCSVTVVPNGDGLAVTDFLFTLETQ